jgi:hypothetical protein
MKQLLITILVVFFLSQAVAQRFDFGLKGGANIGTPFGVAEEGATGMIGVGPMIGLFFKYKLKDRWSFHFDAQYSFKGARFDTPVSGDTVYEYNTITPIDTIPSKAFTSYRGSVEGKFANKYMDFPVYVSYLLGKRSLILAGFQLSYLLDGGNYGSADLEVGDPKHPFTYVEDEPFDQSEELKTWDYAFITGYIYETRRRVNVGATATIGLGSIYDKNYKYLDKTVRNIYLQIFLGFKITKPG